MVDLVDLPGRGEKGQQPQLERQPEPEPEQERGQEREQEQTRERYPTFISGFPP